MASFTTQAQVEFLVCKGAHTTSTTPTAAAVLAQMDLDAARVRAALGGAADPGAGTSLYGLCAEANALLSAAWTIGAHSNITDTDLVRQARYLETAQGKDGDGGLLAMITDLVALLPTDDGGLGPAAVSAPEFLVADLVHFGMDT